MMRRIREDFRQLDFSFPGGDKNGHDSKKTLAFLKSDCGKTSNPEFSSSMIDKYNSEM
jgi:hypothetical protein